jgi:sensor histidine kinase YesM
VSATVSYSISVEFPFWQKWWFYVLIGIFTASLVGLFFIVRIRYIRKKGDTKNKMLLSQLTALKSRMNPHFMFNSLNSIQHLIVKQDIKQSNLYISKFGKLMRNVLDVSGKEKISLQEEIEILELYMDLEKLRFGDDFKYELEFHEHLNTYNIDIPPMILQPFVENAIKHGLLHKKGEKYLKIEFKKEKELVCIITDNGIGRKKSEEIKKRQNPDHVSFATKATEEQMQLLQEYYHESYRFEIEDLMESGEATGTKVSIFMQME